MVDWSKVPDLGGVCLLAAAFATVARRSRTPVSGPWLTGWIMIALHFAALTFASEPAMLGQVAQFVALATLAWAGILFSWASIPYRTQTSGRWMVSVLLVVITLEIGLLLFVPSASRSLTVAAFLVGALPLAVGLRSLPTITHPLRWITVSLYLGLSCFLLVVQTRPGNGPDLAMNAIFCTVYLCCCVNFWYVYRRLTTSAFITTAGFFAWAAVFVVGPSMAAFFPSIHVEDEVWNLPKYVVAVGMILIVLEEQIEHNKHLALHDELTGLPNRRLFQDRLANSLERARRTGTQTALLLIDLDYFKQVNDTVGHHIGDLALQRAAELFAGRVRRSDTVARTGGDEFSVILEEPTSRHEAEQVGRSLIDLLDEPIELGDHTVQIGASVGIAIFPEDAPSPEALRIAADLRMYACKQESRGRSSARPPARAYASASSSSTEVRPRA